MTHLLHEVKDELDWAESEVLAAENQYSQLEAQIYELTNHEPSVQRDAQIETLKEQKQGLKLGESYEILGRAARRFSLLTRVFEVGSQNVETIDIVMGLTDGLLFRLDDTSDGTDEIILQVTEALQSYFHGKMGDETDAQLRDAWLEVEGVLRELGRKI